MSFVSINPSFNTQSIALGDLLLFRNDQQSPRVSNDSFAQGVRSLVESDPHFQKISTAKDLLLGLLSFLEDGGKPNVHIPEVTIGSVALRNVSCVELVCRIYSCDIEGFFVLWDNSGVEINRLFKTTIEVCLSSIDEIIDDPSLEVDDIISMIRLVHECDPYLSYGKITGRRVLQLMDKLLEKHGDPLSLISNVKIGKERVDNLTIYELVYLLWKHPYETDLEDWDFEDDDIYELGDENQGIDESFRVNGESMNQRFKAILERCFIIIQQNLDANLVKDDGFLSFIRCVVRSNEDSEKFVYLMRYFVLQKVNPNLILAKVEIHGNVYINPTCFQVTYLVWKNPCNLWTDVQESELQDLFEAMLDDPRTDLTLKFSERSLTSHHFVKSSNIAFYRRQHGTEKKFYTNGNYEPDERVIDQLHGYSLERMTIAHYAVIFNDFIMLDKFLDLEPRLLNMTCCMTKGKATVNSDRYTIDIQGGAIPINSLEENDQLSGPLSIIIRKPFCDPFPKHIQLVRVTNVSILHLAARVGREGVLAILGSRHPNPAILDSDQKPPQDYLNFSIIEGVVENNQSSKELFRALGLVSKCKRQPTLPEVNQLFHHEGYDLLHDTSRKVAIFVRQRLSKDSFGEASRTNHRWVENLAIPGINRALDEDFKYSGFDRGHLAAAEDATESYSKMACTFQLENAVPQNPSSNRGIWSRLEAHVRKLAQENDLVEVFTGPLFVPKHEDGVRVIKHGVIGEGDVHIPTHLFKVIYIHNRTTTKEIYVLPNEANTARKKFSDFRYKDATLDFIQKHSGILFSEWVRK